MCTHQYKRKSERTDKIAQVLVQIRAIAAIVAVIGHQRTVFFFKRKKGGAMALQDIMVVRHHVSGRMTRANDRSNRSNDRSNNTGAYHCITRSRNRGSGMDG